MDTELIKLQLAKNPYCNFWIGSTIMGNFAYKLYLKCKIMKMNPHNPMLYSEGYPFNIWVDGKIMGNASNLNDALLIANKEGIILVNE